MPGQLMFPSPLVTVPEPVPDVLTVNANSGENVAVAATAAVPIVKLHDPVPMQAPVQPANTDPAAGVAVSVTAVLVFTEALHVPGQLIPLPVTVPVPVPARVTFTGKEVGMKSALTDCAALIVTVQVVLSPEGVHPVHVPIA